jgi:hypothetical protein
MGLEILGVALEMFLVELGSVNFEFNFRVLVTNY